MQVEKSAKKGLETWLYPLTLAITAYHTQLYLFSRLSPP